MPIIDFHAHFLEEKATEAARGKTVISGWGTKPPPPSRITAAGAVMFNPEAQLKDMDARGIDIHVISASGVGLSTTMADPKDEIEIIRKVNDRAAEWVAAYPDRYRASFMLPLRSIDATVAELERSTRDLGMRVANVSTVYNDKYLGHPDFDPFWKAAEASGTVVFIHPEGARDLWFQDYWLWNSIGQSIEETKVMASIIYEGVFEKFPDIKIVIVHGGGYFPHYMGRLDRNADKPDAMRNIKGKPSDYLDRFYYDTCTYDLGVIDQLVKIVGADRLVLGSDYPVGDKDPVAWTKQAPSLSGRALDDVLGGAAARLLGIT